MSEQTESVLVHITGSDVATDIAKTRARRVAVSCHTHVLTASNPYVQIANQELNRQTIVITCLDNPVVLCDSNGQAQDAANQSAGLATPNGALIPINNPYPVTTTDMLWVATGTYPSRVSTTITSYAEQ